MCKEYEHTIAITNRILVQGDFLEQMQKVIHLHPHAVILREKDLSDEEYEILGERILGMCKESGVGCFLHSRISIPVLMAMSKEERSQLRKDFQEISVSCHSMEDMNVAVENGATQIILGTIFETECKKGLKGKGLGFVTEICKACPVPVYAIGGINLERLRQVMEAGAAGGCMMSGFMQM